MVQHYRSWKFPLPSLERADHHTVFQVFLWMIALKQAIQLIVKHLCCLCLGNVFYMCITITDSANIKALDEFYYINCKCIHVYLHSLCIHIITVYIELNVLWYITCIHNLL